jgi:hypothetical protein
MCTEMTSMFPPSSLPPVRTRVPELEALRSNIREEAQQRHYCHLLLSRMVDKGVLHQERGEDALRIIINMFEHLLKLSIKLSSSRAINNVL